MRMPFTPEQFFALFATYNEHAWFVAAGLWLAGAWLAAAAWRRPAAAGPALAVYLAVLWAWSAVAYHAWLFTRINPAAWLFAAAFLGQAWLLWQHRPTMATAFTAPAPRRWIGATLVVYAVAYPALSVLAHGYPASPTFGVPCPTAILTIGLLLTVGGSVPIVVAMVPIAWAAVGGSAALLFGVRADYALLAAGPLLAAAIALERWRPAGATRAAGS